MEQYVFGIDIGGTRTKMGLVSLPEGKILASCVISTEKHNAEVFWQDLFTGLSDLAKQVQISFAEVSGIGVGIGSFDSYVTTIRFDVGNTLSFAKKAAETANVLTISAENQRLSVAGVSLDEEMVNLVKYQHAYSGAARVITAMDEALDRLINNTGRVGL